MKPKLSIFIVSSRLALCMLLGLIAIGNVLSLNAQVLPDPAVRTSLSHVQVSPDGRYILAIGGATGGDAWVFEVTEGKLLYHIGVHNKRIENVMISPDGHYFITHAYKESQIRVWNLLTGNLMQQLDTPYELSTMTFLQGGRMVAVSGLKKMAALSGFDTPRRDHVIAYLNFSEGKLTHHQKIRSDSKNPPVFLSESPDEKHLISANHSLGTSHHSMWSLETGQEVRTFRNRFNVWYDEAYMTEDGKTIYSFKKGVNSIAIMDLPDGKESQIGLEGRIVSCDYANRQSFFLTQPGDLFEFTPTEWGWRPKKILSLKRDDIKDFAINRAERWMATIHTDGAIRLWDMESHVLWISIFPYSDRPYCAMTTAEGFYTAQPKEGTNDLIISIKGEVVPIEAVDLYRNRPDIILSLFPGHNKRLVKRYRKAYEERLTIAKKKQDKEATDLPEQAPSISLLLEKDSSHLGFVELLLQASSQSSPLKRIELVHNGVAQFGETGLPLASQQQVLDTVIRITLLPGKNVLEVWATNQKNVRSRRIIQEIELEAKDTLPKGPRLFLLLVGISDYEKASFMSLRYAKKDVEEVASFFLKHQNDFSELHIKLLADSQATKATIAHTFTEFFALSQPTDIAFVYVSGHGILMDHQAYFVPYDFVLSRHSETGITFNQLEVWMTKIPAQNRLICFDACHSGAQSIYQQNEEEPLMSMSTPTGEGPITLNLSSEDESSVVLLNKLFLDFVPTSGATVIAAARSTGKAYENPNFQNGIFTHFFLKGLETRMADQNRDGAFKVSEIREYIFKSIHTFFEEETEKTQQPNSRKENPYRDIILWNPGLKMAPIDELFKD